MNPTPCESGLKPDMAPQLKRRGMLLGAGATAAAAGVAVLVSRTQAQPSAPAAPQQARAGDGEGYRLSEHVRRYYETART